MSAPDPFTDLRHARRRWHDGLMFLAQLLGAVALVYIVAVAVLSLA